MNSSPHDPSSESPDGLAADGAQPVNDEAALLKAIAAGDKAALAALYDRYSRPLHAVARRVLNDTTEAEDILHDVFITLWTRAGELDTARGTVFTWLVATVRNRAIDRLRRRRRRLELIEASAPEDLGPPTEGAGTDSAERLDLQENARLVRQAVAALAPDQRSALELAFFGGLTQPEIAARLEAPLGTVKARIRRGLLKLRDTLAFRS